MRIRAIASAAAIACACALAACAPAGPQIAAPGGSAPAATSADPLVSLPVEPSLLIFGDSWTWGRAATDPETLGYAARVGDQLGWPTAVDGERASGYLRSGFEGGTYISRIRALDHDAAPDLVVIQGSINDRREDLSLLRAAAEDAWDALAAAYPDASLVVFGPAPQVLPIEPATRMIDEILRRAAADRGVPYVSPIAEEWITTANYDTLIDTSPEGNDHPSDAGHAYLADRLVAALGAVAVREESVVALEETPAPAELG
ncbi:SGNH/GDSL hydrolase family protein [Microbacterium karelineae]|uniref:SGNH/GDSL hydrolase family protein n=1 Tax=Microbacterium karelineae TaxID=2654283 RepID=UPI0018D3C778|nr:SGNH/GDSL hydrolase family protein [Microbacterium karelineae]